MKIVHLCLSNFFIDNYSYQENLQSLTNISSDLAAMKETTLVFYETLKDSL